MSETSSFSGQIVVDSDGNICINYVNPYAESSKPCLSLSAKEFSDNVKRSIDYIIRHAKTKGKIYTEILFGIYTNTIKINPYYDEEDNFIIPVWVCVEENEVVHIIPDGRTDYKK